MEIGEDTDEGGGRDIGRPLARADEILARRATGSSRAAPCSGKTAGAVATGANTGVDGAAKAIEDGCGPPTNPPRDSVAPEERAVR